LQLQVTRPKIFINAATTEGEQVVRLSPGRHVKVPDWVRDTLGYKMGLRDKSIADLTPPPPIKLKQLSVAELRAALAEAEAREAADAKPVEAEADRDADAERKAEEAEQERIAKEAEAERLEAERAEADKPKFPTGLQGGGQGGKKNKQQG
jgi:uncharacterized membrane protein YqiK